MVIYMPMVPEAVDRDAGLRAAGRHALGGVRRVRRARLAARIDDARPAVVVSASCGIEPSRTVEYKPMLDAALDMAEHPPRNCVIVQRDGHRCELIAGPRHRLARPDAGAEPVDPVPVAATDPLYVLYTSGTTGKPKGIVRDNGGHAVALLWSMRHIYDIEPGEVFWAASDVGWVVGHSYIVYGPLLPVRRPCSTRASRSARPTQARSGASRRNTASRRCSRRRPRCGRSARKIPTAPTSGATTCQR